MRVEDKPKNLKHVSIFLIMAVRNKYSIKILSRAPTDLAIQRCRHLVEAKCQILAELQRLIVFPELDSTVLRIAQA